MLLIIYSSTIICYLSAVLWFHHRAKINQWSSLRISLFLKMVLRSLRRKLLIRKILGHNIWREIRILTCSIRWGWMTLILDSKRIKKWYLWKRGGLRKNWKVWNNGEKYLKMMNFHLMIVPSMGHIPRILTGLMLNGNP